MKIKLKIAIITSLLGLFVLSVMVILANSIIMPGFVNVEDSRMIKNVDRVNGLLLEKAQSIDAINYDYSVWDSSYYVITGENTAYGITDIGPGSLERTKLDFVILMNNNGKIIFARDMLSNVEQDYNPSLTNASNNVLYSYFEKNYDVLICRNKSVYFSGIIHLPEGLAIISSRPILKSDGAGPVYGTIIFGQIIDESFVEKASNQVHMSFSIQPYDSISYGDKLKLTMFFNNGINNTPSISKSKYNYSDSVLQIIHVNKTTISGNTLLKDVSGRPVALLTVIDQRDIFFEGKTAVRYMIQSMLLLMIVYIIAGYFLFNRLITSRLIYMTHQIKNINVKKNPSLRLDVKGKDELFSFGKAVNSTLDFIEKTVEEKQAIFAADPDTYFYVDFYWKIIDYKITDALCNLFHKKHFNNSENLNLSKFFSNNIMAKLSEARLKSIENKTPIVLVFDMNKGDSIRILEARIVAVSNTSSNSATGTVPLSNNSDNKFLILLEDITERKEFEKQLLEKNKDLEKFNKFAIDRELRMSELKKEIRDLKTQILKTDKIESYSKSEDIKNVKNKK